MAWPDDWTENVELEVNGNVCVVCLNCPDVPYSKVNTIEVELIDVRAADSIRVTYDKDRDGWSILQASTFSWDAEDMECDSDWQEVAFIEAWAREKKPV